MTKTFALITERKNPPDRRVVFSPDLCKQFLKAYPKADLIVEESDNRVFSNQEYIEKGIKVMKNIEHADIFLGVKEVPIEELIPNKTYLFFSHTIKMQPYNRKLLQAILKNNIELIDHETLVKSNGVRLVGFGRYAGLVGAYNGIRMLGLKEQLFDIPKVETLKDLSEVKQVLDCVKLPAIKIVLTGTGKVGRGAKEVLDHMGIKKVNIHEFLSNDFREPVYCNLSAIDYVKRIDGTKKETQDFYRNPEAYKSDFQRFAIIADMFIAGHFYSEGSPKIISKTDLEHPQFKIKYIADISCDINGPIATTIRPSTIENPFYGYNRKTHSEVNYINPDAIAIMAVDNLPCELPRDASEGFGQMFLRKIIPSFFNGDKKEILKNARITTKKGRLTEKFEYLNSFVKEN